MLGRSRRIAVRAAAVSVFAGVLLVLGSGSAVAGVWMRAICQNPNGTPAGIDGFVFSGQNVGEQGGASGGSSCPGGLTGLPGLKATGVWVGVAADANVPTDATWTYSAPAGSTIVGGSITGVSVDQLTYGELLDDIDAWISSPGDDASGGDLLADCATPSTSSAGGLPGGQPCAENPLEQALVLGPVAPATPLVAAIDHAGGSALYLSAGCSTADTDPCDYLAGSSYNLGFSAGFQWADVLLSDPDTPAGSGFGGSLLAGGSVHGTADLTFSASDQGSGVFRVSVLIDGHVVYQATPDANGGACVSQGTDPTSGAWIFDSQQPCPQSVDLDIPINTTTLRDGEHDVQVIVESPAQDSSTVLDQAFSTDNFTSVAGTRSEGTASVSSTPSVAAAPYALRLDPATAALTASVLHSTYDASSVTLSGQVLQAGAPAPAVTVSARAGSLSGTGYTTVAQTTTNAAGQFTLEVPRGDSRDLEITAGAQDVAFQQLVTPDVSLAVRSLSSARILFTGKVAIASAGSPSPLVEIECYDPQSSTQPWPVVATTTIGKDGTFRYVYRVSPVLAGYRFKFRALIPELTGYWQTAVSAAKEAKVTP